MNIKTVVAVMLGLSILLGVTAEAASKELISNTKIIKHNKSSGGKGIDTIRLNAPKVPKNSCVFFQAATVEYKKRHYGEATIAKKPKVKCNPTKEQCKVGVSWKHSSAGSLNYKVKITWDLTPC